MDTLHVVAGAQLSEHKSSRTLVGKAILYLLRHWKGVDHVSAATRGPMDNNIVTPRAAVARLMPSPGLCRVSASRSPACFLRCLKRHNHNASPAWQACPDKERRHDNAHSRKLGQLRPCSTIRSNISNSNLRTAGYAQRTLRKKRTVARAFARWTRRRQIAMNDLNDGHIAAFVARSPRNRKPM